jgi:hypothetical protein
MCHKNKDGKWGYTDKAGKIIINSSPISSWI